MQHPDRGRGGPLSAPAGRSADTRGGVRSQEYSQVSVLAGLEGWQLGGLLWACAKLGYWRELAAEAVAVLCADGHRRLVESATPQVGGWGDGGWVGGWVGISTL